MLGGVVALGFAVMREHRVCRFAYISPVKPVIEAY